MTGRERVGRGLELQRDVDRLVDRHRRGVGALARWVRLSRPRVTSALVPSGKTSSSLAERKATGALGAEPDRQRRVADDLQRLVDRPVVGQRPGVVGPLVRRLTPRQPAGARDPRAGPDVGPHVEPVVPWALGGQRPGLAPGRPASPARPASAGVLGQVRLGPGGVAHEEADRSVGVDAVVLVPQPVAEPADHLRDEVDVRPGSEVSVDMWLHGPISRALGPAGRRTCGTSCCGSRRPTRRPATWRSGCARSRAAASRGASTGRLVAHATT